MAACIDEIKLIRDLRDLTEKKIKDSLNHFLTKQERIFLKISLFMSYFRFDLILTLSTSHVLFFMYIIILKLFSRWSLCIDPMFIAIVQYTYFYIYIN
jgi:hypothetical protein